MQTAAATLAIFVYGLTSALLGVLLPVYPLSLPEKGSLALANALGLMVASLLAGPLGDRKGKKPLLILGLALSAGSVALAASIANFAGLVAVYFAIGAGGGIVTTGANSLISDLEPRRRGPALNFANLFFGLGGVLTTLAASYWFSTTTLCYSIATLTVLTLIANVIARNGQSQTGSALQMSLAGELFTNRLLPWFCLLLFLYIACEVGIWNWLKTYLLAIGFSARTAGGVVSYGFALGMLAGRLGVSRILTRIPAMPVITVSGIAVAASTFAMLHFQSRPAITAAVFVAGLSMAPIYPTTLSLIGDAFPRATGTAMGLAITSGWLGLAVSSPIIGALAAASLQSALLLLPALAVALVLVSLVLRSQLQKTVTF